MPIRRILRLAFVQKVLGINREAPIPVCPTVQADWYNIKMGEDVGFNGGCYIQSINGIRFGSNVRVGPNVCIISADHDPADFDKHIEDRPIEIGDNVWIGANTVILPGVKVGSNVIIGAGSIVVHDLPDNSIAAGNPCRVIRQKGKYKETSA